MSAIAALGPRLRAIAEQVLPDQPMADLCCDHAQLAVALVLDGRVPRAVAVDVATAPIAGARARIDAAGVVDRVALRQGDGALALGSGEVATVVIAGVGAPLAGVLVTAGQRAGVLVDVRRLVLQANDGFPRLGTLRLQLAALGWGLVDEVLVRERRHIHVILVAEPTAREQAEAALDDARDLGPILRHGNDPLHRDWLLVQRRRATATLAGMDRARRAIAPTERRLWQQWAQQLDAALRGRAVAAGIDTSSDHGA